ncbi:hypothetical protein RB195_012245 [Necator americanus]|uniref:Transposase n=1 Tax=Necator americanus TaxID=51031 RepID=A0ABR1D7R9_NECAM
MLLLNHLICIEATANLLTLRDFTLVTTWAELASKSNEEYGVWLADRGLQWKKRLCPYCGSPVNVVKQANVDSLHKC